MVLQLEDCTNVLKAIHPGIDFIFLFDRPCGHDRGRKYRFYVKNMDSRYVGAQQEMHPTNIKNEFGFLGPREKILEVGDDHHRAFQEGGDVPF